MRDETRSTEGFPDSFTLVGDLITKNVVFFNQVFKSALQIFNSFIFADDGLNDVGSVHGLSDESALSFVGVSISILNFFVFGFESDILLFFSGCEVASNSDELLHQRVIF